MQCRTFTFLYDLGGNNVNYTFVTHVKEGTSDRLDKNYEVKNMSLKNKFFSVLTVALSAVVFSTFAMAQETTPVPAPEKTEKHIKGERGHGNGHKGMDGRHGKRAMMHILGDLNLTDAQKAQIKAIRENNKPDAAIVSELRTIREAKRAGTAITPEQKDRMKAIREQRKLKAKAIHEQIQAILNPEQKAQLDVKKAEMRQRMEQRRTDRKNKVAPAATGKPFVK